MTAKIDWPATVKVQWTQVTGTPNWERVDLELGDREVAVLLAIQVHYYNNDLASLVSAWLHKQSEPTTKAGNGQWENGGWLEDPGVLDFDQSYVGNQASGATWKVYPYPIVLIRQPSVIIDKPNNMIATLGLWYVRQEVTDAEMAQLMVKDHA